MRAFAIVMLTAFVFVAGGAPAGSTERAAAMFKPEAAPADFSGAGKAENKKAKKAKKADSQPTEGGSAPRGAFQNPSSSKGPGPAPSNRTK